MPTRPSLDSRATWRRTIKSSARFWIRLAILRERLESSARARAILERLAELYPTVTLFQNRLAMSHSYVGLARRRAGRPAEAAAEFRRAVAIMEQLSARQPDGFNLYNLACFRALLSGIAAEPGSDLTSAQVSSFAEQAVLALRRAVDAGFRNVGFMRRDAIVACF